MTKEKITPDPVTCRNKNDIEYNGDIIDGGSLWTVKENQVILVDDDRYIALPYDPEEFEMI